MRVRGLEIILLTPLIFPATVNAEYAEMTASSAYCKAEIRAGQYGNGQAESLPTIYAGKTAQGQVWTMPEGIRICARREAIPGNCDTPVANGWSCISPVVGISEGQVVKGSF